MTRILIVEDHEMNRDMLTRRLQRKGFETGIATNGQQALVVAESYQPHIILMDMSLPIMDGWQATRLLKQTVSLQHIPVIGLSAHARDTDIDRGLEAGCDAYAVKPIDFEQLLLTIRSLL
jgi:CheY-like chemotaxis protein